MAAWSNAVGDFGIAVSIDALNKLLLPELQSYSPFVLAMLHRWVRSGLLGLSDEVKDFLLHGSRWEEKGSGTYLVLLVNDPERGALTDQELRNIQDTLDQALIGDDISVEDYALAWFFIATGVRPVQIHRMTKKDVRVSGGPEGKEVTLLIPLAKGGNTVQIEKWRRRAPTVLANCLIRYLALPSVSELPEDARLFEFTSQAAMSARITRVFTKLKTWSARLQGKIPVFPYRFRYTLGTRALADGASDHDVARLLTHRKTTCIQYYRASMPALQRPIRNALGESVGFFAKAFNGKLIADLTEATRTGEPSAVIRDFLRLTGATVGACGTRTKCFMHAPIACLTCHFFEPFRDAPWEDLLAWLEAEGQGELEHRIREIHVHSMTAVREIIGKRDGVIGMEMEPSWA